MDDVRGDVLVYHVSDASAKISGQKPLMILVQSADRATAVNLRCKVTLLIDTKKM